jgi:hypothetical protein
MHETSIILKHMSYKNENMSNMINNLIYILNTFLHLSFKLFQNVPTIDIEDFITMNSNVKTKQKNLTFGSKDKNDTILRIRLKK